MDREPPQPPHGSPTPGSPDDPDDGFRGGTPDWIDGAEWQRMCAERAARDDDEEPPDPDEEFYSDPDSAPPPGWEQVPLEAITVQAEADAAEHAALMARLMAAGLDGYAHSRGKPPVPGIVTGPAAGFGQGCPLDDAAPSTVVSALADEASGEDRSFTSVNDDQLMGLIGTRQRLACCQQWELLTCVAEFIRRRSEPGCAVDLPGRMPQVWNEHAASDLGVQLHLTAGAASELLSLAHDLTVKLPATSLALRNGIVDLDKARIIALHCSALTPDEARAAEAVLFAQDTVEEMTWGMIRDRIARAVIEVNPDAARKRRERAAQDKRVEVIPEHSGNCQIAGRELPPAAALAASQNLTARARELRQAGVSGGMDELRALAYLEKLGALNPLQGSDTDTPGPEAGGSGDGPDGGPGGNGERGPDGPPPGGPGTPGGGAAAARGDIPPGFAARVNLTVPLATLLGLAERPGVMSRAGPVDPALARDLAAAAARNARSTWCITITGPDSRPIAHGCGRPPPRGSPRHHRTRDLDTQAHPDQAAARDGPAYTPVDDCGQPGSGTVRLDIAALTGTADTNADSGKDLVFALESLAGPCDHKHQAAGHDPGVRLRHLTGILHACCTFPPCRRPEAQSDYEHSTPYEQGGRTCLCEAGPVCRHNHRDKQAPGWHLEHAGARGWFRWTTPSGRTYLSRPTQYPD